MRASSAADGTLPWVRASRRCARWLTSFEGLAWISFLGAIAFLRSRGLRMDRNTLEYTLLPMLPLLPKAMLGGVALQAAYLALRFRSLGRLRCYGRRLVEPGWWLLSLRLWVAAMLMTYAYFWLKVSVPLLNERLWDAELWRLDRLLHGGLSPSVFLTQLLRGTGLVELLDRWYAIWVPSVFYTMAFFVGDRRRLLRRRFVLSCVLLWSLGAWIYLAVPAVGPVYTAPEPWIELGEAMPAAEAGQALLWENYQTMIGGRGSGLSRFNPTRGVAALPSLHVAAHVLFALWARRHARALFLPFTVAAALTFVGSVVTGWHYAVDGYVGALLAWLCYRLSSRLEPSARLGQRRGSGEDLLPRQEAGVTGQ